MMNHRFEDAGQSLRTAGNQHAPQRAVIIDDDRASAFRLSELLKLYCPEIKIVGMAYDRDCAAAQLRRTDFDLAFLDVELDTGTSFAILSEIPDPQFRIVIVSAFERYALPAIKASAVDYLVKPVHPDELAACWRKLRGASGRTPVPEPAPVHAARKVILRQGDQVYIKQAAELFYMKACGFYTQVYFHHQGSVRSITVSKPLNEIEAEWQDPALIRVHKSFIINLQFVRQVRKSGEGLLLQLEAGVQIPVARRRTAAFMSQYSA